MAIHVPFALAWFTQAACKFEDSELFFPNALESAEPARVVCGRCEVRKECLEYALSRPELLGVWGGTSQEQRRRLRRTWK